MDTSAKEFGFMAASVAAGFLLAMLALTLWNRYAPAPAATPAY